MSPVPFNLSTSVSWYPVWLILNKGVIFSHIPFIQSHNIKHYQLSSLTDVLHPPLMFYLYNYCLFRQPKEGSKREPCKNSKIHWMKLGSISAFQQLKLNFTLHCLQNTQNSPSQEGDCASGKDKGSLSHTGFYNQSSFLQLTS